MPVREVIVNTQSIRQNHVTRREFLKATSAAVCATSIAGCASKQRKPNLLFIWTDEQRADTMAAYGNKAIKTPNLNQLASESFVFDKAYVSQPVCTPSRSTVMTGLWPHASGLEANNIPLPQNIPCFPELVNDTEYVTAYMGKWHLGDEIFKQHGFDEWVSIEDNYIRYYSDDRDKSTRSDYHHFLVDKGYSPDNQERNTFSRSDAARKPIEHCKPKFLETTACKFLQQNKDKPFMLYINFLEPHMPFFGPLDDLHDPSEVALPDNFSDPLETNEPIRAHLKRASCLQKYGENPEQIRDLIKRYWGLVSQVDQSVGTILDTLKQLGLDDNTIIVYTSDHGDMMGSHHLVEKTLMYEESVRVPWLMRVPWMNKTQTHIPGPVSHIDLVPTLLDLMGSDAGKDLPGQSLVPLMQGGSVEEDHVFIEWNTRERRQPTAEDLNNPDEVAIPNIDATAEQIFMAKQTYTRTVVSPDGWKLCLSDTDRNQLFNLNDDPGETTNLFDSGRHDDVIRRLTQKIQDWQSRVGDDVWKDKDLGSMGLRS
ncbi:sulfatase-like hydrolase/transferase [candidate division KSB1 bacterium]|nr:sulfatase-like hydrolase/transferase [candidate division KSB1 bacterium]